MVSKKSVKGDGENTTRAYAVPALDRTLDIVEFMADHTQPWGVNELARELEIPVNSVFRIMRRLVERGYAESAPENGNGNSGYVLSTRFFSLGAKLHTRFELRNRARRHLEKLAARTEETCQLNIPKENGMLVLDVANPDSDFFLQIVPGATLKLHCNAFGKAVMAFMDQDDAKEMLKGKLEKLTEHTITNRNDIIASFAEIRETGLSYDRQEYTDGIYCIGTVVLDVNGLPVAGLGMTGMSVRRDVDHWAELEMAVLECGAAVAADIGYTEDLYGTWIGRLENKL